MRVVRLHELLIVLATIALAQISERTVYAATLDQEPQSTLSILVDLSQTWHNDASRRVNQHQLELVVDAAIELGKVYRPPIFLRVLAIGDSSFLRPPLCESIYDPKLIGSQRGQMGVFTQERSLKQYLRNDCIRFVLSRPKEKFTDISGAIESAARMAGGSGTRSIVILSDMLEELPKGQQPPKLSLAGLRVLIAYRVLDEDRRQPAKLDARLDAWKTKLLQAGASVEIVPDQSITAAQIARILRP